MEVFTSCKGWKATTDGYIKSKLPWSEGFTDRTSHFDFISRITPLPHLSKVPIQEESKDGLKEEEEEKEEGKEEGGKG